MDEEDLTKAIDFKHNIVRVSHTDGSKKAYRIPDLTTKTIGEVLQCILECTTCPFHGHTYGVRLYEVTEEEGLFANTVVANLLIGTETLRAVYDRWNTQRKRYPYEMVIKKEAEPIKPQRSTTPLLRSIFSSPKKSHRSNITETAIERMGDFVDEGSGIYVHSNDQSPQGSRNQVRGSRPLSQMITAEWKEGLDKEKISHMSQHQQVLISWVNSQLSFRNMVIYDLHKDIRDGVALINLLEILSGKTVKEYHRKPTTVQQMLQNCDLVIKFLIKLDIQVQARPKDFYNGNMAIIFGALYLLIKKVKEKKIQRPKRGRRTIVSVELLKNTRFSMVAEESGLKSLGEIGEMEEKQSNKVQTPKCYTEVDDLVVDTSNATPAEKQSVAEDELERALTQNSLESFTPKKAKITLYDVDRMLETFNDEMQEEESRPGTNDAILDDILQTAKRLKEMKITRAPAIQQKSNINLADLNDDELEALLNDDNYDIGGDLEPLELQLEECGGLASRDMSPATFTRQQTLSPMEMNNLLEELEIDKQEQNYTTKRRYHNHRDIQEEDPLTDDLADLGLDGIDYGHTEGVDWDDL